MCIHNTCAYIYTLIVLLMVTIEQPNGLTL